jgi:release factor glutamine methyltransferase
MNHLIADNTVQSMRAYLTAQLAGLYDDRESSNIVAELFSEFKGWSRSDLAINRNERITESEMLRFHFALKRLKNKEPLQYVLQKAWFCGMAFYVDTNVLIPRPETEELVALIVDRQNNQSAKILDIGTGSGCIAISLQKKIANSNVTAIDVSDEALSIAKKNASTLHSNVNFYNCDILKEIPMGKFDVVVSNPPYIDPSEATDMRDQVTQFEPHLALFTEKNQTLQFYERIIDLAPSLLEKNGKLYFEIHENQKENLTNLLNDRGIHSFQFHQDLQDKYRILEISFA